MPVKNKTVSVYIVMLLSFLVLLTYAKTTWVDLDEGYYLYKAQKINEGYAPYKDFVARDMYYLHLLAFFIRVFGKSILAGRLLSVFAGVLGVYFVYLIGRRLYGADVGLVAAVLYGLTPYPVLWNSLIKTGPTQRLFVLVALYFLVLSLSKSSKTFYFVSGFFLGISIFTRITAAFLIPGLVALIFYVNRKNLAPSVIFSTYLLLGVFVAVLPGLMSISYSTNIVSSNLLFINPVYYSRGFSLITLDKPMMLYPILRESMYLVFPSLIFVAWCLRGRGPRLIPTFTLLFFLLVFSATYIIFGILYYPTMTPAFVVVFVVLLAAASVISAKISQMEFRVEPGKMFSNAFLAFWAASIGAFYFMWYKMHVFYFAEFSPILCIAAAVVFVRLFERRRETVVMLALCVFALSMIFVQVFYLKGFYVIVPGVTRIWSQESMSSAAEYVRERTAPGDEVFAGNAGIAFLSGRPLVLDVSYPMDYIYPNVDEEVLRDLGLPKVEKIMSYIDSRRIKYVVLDDFTEMVYFFRTPEFGEYIMSHYRLEAEFEGVRVLKRSET